MDGQRTDGLEHPPVERLGPARRPPELRRDGPARPAALPARRRPRSRRPHRHLLPTVAATLVAAAGLAACGGGEVIAVVGFLGTGGGQFIVDAADPARPGFTVSCPGGLAGCPSTLTLAVDDGRGDGTGPPADLYATGYPIRVQRSEGPIGSTCTEGLRGRVDGDRVSIPGCFTGRYRTINEVVSDDGRTALFAPFRADTSLSAGVWVDTADPSRQLRFASSVTQRPDNDGSSSYTSSLRGCQVTGTARRGITVTVRVILLDGLFGSTPYVANETTRISGLLLDGETTLTRTATFLGISALEVDEGGRKSRYERRPLPNPGPC